MEWAAQLMGEAALLGGAQETLGADAGAGAGEVAFSPIAPHFAPAAGSLARMVPQPPQPQPPSDNETSSDSDAPPPPPPRAQFQPPPPRPAFASRRTERRVQRKALPTANRGDGPCYHVSRKDILVSGLDGAVILVVGYPGCGKTTVVRRLVHDFARLRDIDGVTVFTMQPHDYDFLPQRCVVDRLDFEVLANIQDAHDSNPGQSRCVIFDDVLADGNDLKRKEYAATFASLITQVRHLNLKIIVVCHWFSQVPPICQMNATHAALFFNASDTFCAHAFEKFGGMTPEVKNVGAFRKIFRECTRDGQPDDEGAESFMWITQQRRHFRSPDQRHYEGRSVKNCAHVQRFRLQY